MRSHSKLKEMKRKRTKTIWERVEPEDAFMERKTRGRQTKATTSKSPESTQTKKEESKSVQRNLNTKKEVVFVDIADESSEEEDERKYQPALFDILEHYDFATNEQALDFPIKDVTTLSVRRAIELRKENPNLQGENNVLDSILHPRADVSSISSHSAAARRLMRSMPNIDDKVLQKLVGRASDAHLGIVKHLSEKGPQVSNVEMITPPGSPRPSTSERDCQRNERRPIRRMGNDGNTRKVTLASSTNTREVIVVTSEEEQNESDEDESHKDPWDNDRDRVAYCRLSDEQNNGDEAAGIDQDSDDDDETILYISSPSEADFDDEDA